MTTTTTQTTGPAIYARCSIGRGRWYWCVWRSTSDWFQGHDAATSGVAASAALAEQQAVAACDVLAPGQEHRQEATCLAREIRRRQNRRSKPPTVDPSPLPSSPELVWYYHGGSYDGDSTRCEGTPHQVLRKTARKIVVDDTPYEPGGVRDQLHARERHFDRDVLEREGELFDRWRRCGTWYTTEGYDRSFPERVRVITSTGYASTLGPAKVLNRGWPRHSCEVYPYQSMKRDGHGWGVEFLSGKTPWTVIDALGRVPVAVLAWSGQAAWACLARPLRVPFGGGEYSVFAQHLHRPVPLTDLAETDRLAPFLLALPTEGAAGALVFADWLEERGNDRGAAVMRELAASDGAGIWAVPQISNTCRAE
jgi:hypothetical protein